MIKQVSRSGQSDSGPPRRSMIGTLLMLPIGLIIMVLVLLYLLAFRGGYFPGDFEQAKRQLPAVVEEAIRELRDGKINISDLEYRVELRDDPQEKLRSRVLPQPYQAASLLLKEGKKIGRGETVSFVKVNPFKVQGRQFTVKPSSQIHSEEINVDDYIRNLISSLFQTFEAMNINLSGAETSLSKFI